MPDGTILLPQPTPAQLAELTALHQSARHLDAHELCRGLAPLTAWSSATALVLAGRFASRWGNSQLSNQLHQRAYRVDPQEPMALYYKALTVGAKHGSFEALLFTRHLVRDLPLQPETKEQAYLWLFHARMLGTYRDFTAAEPIITRVLDRFADDPWVWVDKADFLESQDLYADALEAASEASRRQPGYNPAVISQAHLLQLLDRDDEALALLRDSVPRLQSGALVQMLVGMLEESGKMAEVPTLVDLAERYLPLADRFHQTWMAGRRFMAAYRTGETVAALESAKRVAAHSGYYRILAERLAAVKTPGRRIQLAVGFVRQHHMTCAPATLAAISNYWGVPADHLEIARLICYDGSPDHVERDWAEKTGWHVREFRVTADAARALLDRGCPFTVVTVEIDSAHMQGVIGYDSTLDTLLVRDPYLREFREWLAPEFFKSYSAHGPRGMVLLPADKAHLLDGIELPDVLLYNQVYAFRRSLHRHDRPAAEAAVTELRCLDAGNLLTHWMALDLAQYDGRFASALEEIRAIRALFPNDNTWRLAELRTSERLGDVVGHRKLLHELGVSRQALGTLRREYAEDLARDAREHGRAGRILRGLLRRQGTDPRTLRAYANLLWDLREFAESTQIYRLAACRADKVEYHWNSYFIACRYLGQTEEGLALLRSRVTRWGAASSLPARTLFDSLNAMDQTPEAFAVLQAARALRPEDGDLLLFSAEGLTRYGHYEEAAALLEFARAHESRSSWLRSAARIADYRREHKQALAFWQELAARSPADHHIHAAIARLLVITAGKAAAIAYLQQACLDHPHLLPLHHTLVTRLRDGADEEALAAVDRLLALDATDAWAVRERALVLRRLRRLDEALATADHAIQLAPQVAASHGVRAEVLQSLGRHEEARAGYAEGIRRSIDADWLFEAMLWECRDFADRRATITFLHGQMMAQRSFENAILQFRVSARSIVPAGELATMLREYHQTNLAVWSGWSALSSHCLETGDLAQAVTLAQVAAERFPLIPRAWTDLALVREKSGDTSGQIAAIEKALAINPAWSQASRQLSAAHERQLRLDLSEHVLRRAVAAEPGDATNHGWLADILWRLRKPTEAIDAVETALSLNPRYAWAWDRLQTWSREEGDPARAARLALQLTETRAGEPNSWMQLVRLRFNDADVEANLAALDRAIQLDPRETEAWDLRAELLTAHRRYDEAVQACHPSQLSDPPPMNLQGRAAWVEARRGSHDEAVKKMEAVVEQHPDYAWGWARLTEWYSDKGKHADVRRCAEKWAWLEPDKPAPHGYLGVVHLNDKRAKEAKEAFTRAVALDPLYDFGLAELLKLHLADSEFDAVQQILKHYETHYPPGESLRAEMRWHLAVKDRKAATATLARLARLPGNASAPLRGAVNLACEKGWYDVVEEALGALLAEDSAQAEVGEHWMAARRKQERRWPTLWYLLTHRQPARIRHELLGSYVSWLGEEKSRVELWFVCQLWKRPLRTDLLCWGLTGYALATAGRFRATARWARDWKTRVPSAAPWMLSNLILSLETLGRHEQAIEVLDVVLLLPPDHVYDQILAWRACEYAMAGDPAAAAGLLEKLGSGEKSKFYQTILSVTRLMIATQQAPESSRAAKAGESITRLREYCAEYPALITDPALKRIYHKALDYLAKTAGRSWLRLRSKLPLFTLSPPVKTQTQTPAANPVPWWVIFLAASMIVRACSGMH